jgi:hypothetical protein
MNGRSESNGAAMVAGAMNKPTICLVAVLPCVACVTEDNVSFRVGETDTDTDTDTDSPPLCWAVVAGDDQIVGWLSWPSPDILHPHDAIFSGVNAPSQVFVTTMPGIVTAEYGFVVSATGPAYVSAGQSVLYTGHGCSGVPHSKFGDYAYKPGGLSAGDCIDKVFGAAEQVTLYFDSEADFAASLDLFWPGAEGIVAKSDANPSGIYLIPRDQEWPEMIQTRSALTPNGTCVNLPPTPTCAIRMIEINESLGMMPPPYSLVEIQP